MPEPCAGERPLDNAYVLRKRVGGESLPLPPLCLSLSLSLAPIGGKLERPNRRHRLGCPSDRDRPRESRGVEGRGLQVGPSRLRCSKCRLDRARAQRDLAAFTSLYRALARHL